MEITYTCLECGKEITNGGRIYCANCLCERESAQIARRERTIRRIIQEGVSYDEAQIFCPHCGEVYDIDTEIEPELLEPGKNNLTCYCCGGTFRVETYVFRSFTTRKLD